MSTQTTTAPTTTHTVLRAQGFSCPSCVSTLQGLLTKLPGVTSATVHFNSQTIEVDHDPAQTSVEDLIAAVASAGYAAQLAA